MVSRMHVRPAASVPPAAAPLAPLTVATVTARPSGRLVGRLKSLWRSLSHLEPAGGGETLAEFQAKLAQHRGTSATDVLWTEYDVARPAAMDRPPPPFVWRC